MKNNILFSLAAILLSTFTYSQPVMTSKEGFYFTLKANNYGIEDAALQNPSLLLRWFDMYVKIYDNANYQYNSKDEFKWPAYSKKVVTEINQGVESADFNKIYSYTCDATFGTWDSQSSSFPITQIWSGIRIASYPLTYNDFTFEISPTWNNRDFDYKLKMDPSKAESFVASRKDNNGNVNRKITAKIIYNVVNKSMEKTRSMTTVQLGIYIHKIIFMNGSTVLGEIKPNIDYYDKVNLIKINPDITKMRKVEIEKTITDIDGNVYHTVTIGEQVWLIENLKTTKLNDGTSIPNVTDRSTWANSKSPGYCWYNNDVTNKNTYGALYNWHTINTAKLAPKGWHVPTDEEWTTLITFLGDGNVVGDKLKQTGTVYWSPNTGSTNETNFTALPGGSRVYGGSFGGIENYGNWWSSSERDANSAWYYYMNSNYSYVRRQPSDKYYGYSVRCIRNDNESTVLEESNSKNYNNNQTEKANEKNKVENSHSVTYTFRQNQSNENSQNYTGSIRTIIAGLEEGQKCRIVLNEYPSMFFFLRLEDLIKCGLVVKTDNILTSAAEGKKVVINVSDRWIIAIEVYNDQQNAKLKVLVTQ